MKLVFLALVFQREEVPSWLEPVSRGSAVPSRGTGLDSVAVVTRLTVTCVVYEITKHRKSAKFRNLSMNRQWEKIIGLKGTVTVF